MQEVDEQQEKLKGVRDLELRIFTEFTEGKFLYIHRVHYQHFLK